MDHNDRMKVLSTFGLVIQRNDSDGSILSAPYSHTVFISFHNIKKVMAAEGSSAETAIDHLYRRVKESLFDICEQIENENG